MKAAVLTVSDGVARASARTGAATCSRSCSRGEGYEVERRVVPDERDAIAEAIAELAGEARLVLTTGGTGLAPRDVTPEATRPCSSASAPGIAEAIRADSIAKTPHGAALARRRRRARPDARRQPGRLDRRLPRRLRGAAARRSTTRSSCWPARRRRTRQT